MGDKSKRLISLGGLGNFESDWTFPNLDEIAEKFIPKNNLISPKSVLKVNGNNSRIMAWEDGLLCLYTKSEGDRTTYMPCFGGEGKEAYQQIDYFIEGVLGKKKLFLHSRATCSQHHSRDKEPARYTDDFLVDFKPGPVRKEIIRIDSMLYWFVTDMKN
jgi:hypothetical protein